MKQAQILTYGLDGVLADSLHRLAQDHGLFLRPIQQLAACRNAVRDGGPAVLVVRLGKDVVGELSLVQEMSEVAPDTAVVVVGDSDNPALAAVAWDLGARCVLQPPQPMELLPPIVLQLLVTEKP